MTLCVQKGLCDRQMDALSSLQSALARGLSIENVRTLATLFVEHQFLTEDKAHTFLADIPVFGESACEPQAEITDQVLGDPSSDLGSMILSRPSFSASEYMQSFTDSQRRAYEWISEALSANKQIQAAIVGPAGTGN